MCLPFERLLKKKTRKPKIKIIAFDSTIFKKFSKFSHVYNNIRFFKTFKYETNVASNVKNKTLLNSKVLKYI